MIFTNDFDYPELEQVTDEKSGSRYYNFKEYKKMASVTTIIGATSDNSGLDAWRAWVGEEKAKQLSKEATNIGKLMHTHLEHHVMGIDRPGGNNHIHKMATEMANIIIDKGLSKVDECWGQEVMVYYPHLYAGTVDFIGVHQGSPAIVDYKTSKKIKKIEHVEGYFLQLCAYAAAHNELFNTNIRKGVILMATRPVIETKQPADFKEYIIEGNTFDFYMNEWLNRVEKYYNLNDK
jgi:genome maintenance exonuclease 1